MTREVKHYRPGDKIVVVSPWHPTDKTYGIRLGEVYTCLDISHYKQGNYTAIDNGKCVEEGRVIDGFAYRRFNKVDS